MNRYSYRERDYAFGRTIMTLRSATGLTQTSVGDVLGVSRRTVGSWEKGDKYPKPGHLKGFIVFALEHGAFPAAHEAEVIRSLWEASGQQVQLDEAWLATAIQSLQATAATQLLGTDLARSRDYTASRLPLPPNRLIGRESELADLSVLLDDLGCRLLTLTGPGGVGKSRLALEVAHAHVTAYTDGVALVELAAATTPDRIVSAVAERVALPLTGQSDPTAHLLNYLGERNLLLILENFEHLLGGTGLVQDILQRAPQVKILVTSRERLDLRAEWLFDVDGLSYPAVGTLEMVPPPNAAELTGYSAIRLFVQRALQVRPGLRFSEKELLKIARICQHVAGLPLAIELAAAGVYTLSVAETERRIHANLDSLSTTLRDIPPRHRSLRAVFDTSWDLLAEPERTLLSRLSVFRGGCTVEAAERVTGERFSDLAALVGKSLLRQVNPQTHRSSDNRASDAAEETRFVLLEPIREYAWEQLTLRGESSMLRSAHVSYYLNLAQRAALRWELPTATSVIGVLRLDYDNLRAALQWTLGQGDVTDGLNLAVALGRFWRGSGNLSEGRRWLSDLLELTGGPDDTNDPSDAALCTARLRAMDEAAWLATDQHDFVQADRLFKESAALRRALGEKTNETAGETNLLFNAAFQARSTGHYRQATALLERRVGSRPCAQ